MRNQELEEVEKEEGKRKPTSSSKGEEDGPINKHVTEVACYHDHKLSEPVRRMMELLEESKMRAYTLQHHDRRKRIEEWMMEEMEKGKMQPERWSQAGFEFLIRAKTGNTFK